MWIRPRSDHSFVRCWKRTLSAQLHFVAALFTVPAGWLLIVQVAPRGLRQALLVTIFAAVSTLVFTASALYHFVSDGFECHELVEKWLNRFDHFAILMMIAGCYTAFIPKALSPFWAWCFLIFVWCLALLGALYVLFRGRMRRMGGRSTSTLIYILYGCVGLFLLPALSARFNSWQLGLLLSGGGIYIAGAIIYYLERFRASPRAFDLHEVWHLAVIGAYLLHYFLIRSIYLKEVLA